ncbi:MAG: ATP-binding protein [Oscillospiraceae bacterium]|jgi:energy-coupling factor transporter ATP-binding protein EcfA2|nr:ATP-binding protein [Oscillospiraceae bacterium]
MASGRIFEQAGRKIVVTGHYGSGKTEFAVSLALLLAAEKAGKLALIDLDVVNPYFRSRERRDILEDAGIAVYGSMYAKEITAEMPALGADVRAPLEDADCRVIIDAGGNDSGALVLNQYTKYLADGETTVLAVVNANRPETRDAAGTLAHIAAIEEATGLAVTGVVNNCHLVRETSADAVIRGHKICTQICETTGRRLWCDCYPAGIVAPEELPELSGNLMPMGLYMRPTWLDR